MSTMSIPPQLTGAHLRRLLLSHTAGEVDRSAALPTATGGDPKVSLVDRHGQNGYNTSYHVLGRIIHKRKLSKKLFFLDIALMQLKEKQTSIPPTVDSTFSSEAEGIRLSQWQEEAPGQDDLDTTSALVPKKLEIIAKVPQHTLKELDTLWHGVQLGSVVRVTGHLEISERKHKKLNSSEGATSTQIQQQQMPLESQTDNKTQWSVIMHCSTIDMIEPWQGKDTFQPIPGSAEIYTSPTKHQRDEQQQQPIKGHKRTATKAGLTNEEGDTTGSCDGQGVPTRQHCKFWLNSGKCSKENCDLWHEKDIAKLKLARRLWVEERIQTKRQISHHIDDPHRTTTKNQHRERSLHFAKWLIDTFSRSFLSSGSGVLDIAGGRGDLSFDLQTRQGIPSTIIDPKPDKGLRKWQRRWVTEFKKRMTAVNQSELKTDEQNGDGKQDKMADDDDQDSEDREGAQMEKVTFESFIPTRYEFPLQLTEPARIQAMMDDHLVASHQKLFDNASILVGLHPDQATEPIVRMALRLGKPFAIIPCCVFSRENPHRRLPRFQQVEGQTEEKSETQGDPSHNETSGEGEKGEIDFDDNPTRPVTSYDDFVQWLMTLHPDIETTWLNFEGMNRVVYWRGPQESCLRQ